MRSAISCMQTEGIPPEDASRLTARVSMETFKVSEKGEQKDKGASFLLAFFLILTLYMTILMYGAFILRSVMEEKTTRVVEVIVSSIKPFSLMLGKIVGIAAVGFTQYALWVLMASVAFLGVLPGLALTGGLGLPRITPVQAVFFIVFFILGFFLYGTLYAAIGAMFNSEQEAQQMAALIVIPLLIPILTMWIIIRDPDSTTSVILSLIPFFTPLLMYLRMLVESPPLWQVGLSLVLTILTVLLFIFLAGRIYRVGMLMTGKKPSLKDIYRWLKA